MSGPADGQIRRSQVITTWGPGALLDLPRDSAIVGGLDEWPRTNRERIEEPRLAAKLQGLLRGRVPEFYAPPANHGAPWEQSEHIKAWRFPAWCVVTDRAAGTDPSSKRSRRLVKRRALDAKGRYDGRPVVPTRFVRACRRGHVDDLDWRGFVHKGRSGCLTTGDLWLDEIGTSGDLADLSVRCVCGASRRLLDASEGDSLGRCEGYRPWLGADASEGCTEASRLLIRTASNSWFPQLVSVLSLPRQATATEEAVRSVWPIVGHSTEVGDLRALRKIPSVAAALGAFDDEEVFTTIRRLSTGESEEPPVKSAELEVILAAPKGFDTTPEDPNFHARRLPSRPKHGGVASVVQLHRLREVLTLTGFTRFEANMPTIHGDYPSDVKPAPLAERPTWFPAVENRGEGVFLEFDAQAIRDWERRGGPGERIAALSEGHERWRRERRKSNPFPGGAYILLHTLSHLLMRSLALDCGYPASSIRERIYVEEETGYGFLLYTASPDAEGTLGGLVQQAHRIEAHLERTLTMAGLCSNDPVCSEHRPDDPEERYLHGAACHACALVAETSCEMRNEYLDRALVVPVIGETNAAFFPRS